MYNKIKHPKTGKWYSSSSSIGSTLIEKYANKLNLMGGGSVNPFSYSKTSVSDKIGNNVPNGYLYNLSGGMNNPSGNKIIQEGQAMRQRTLDRRSQIKDLTDTISGEIKICKNDIIKGNSSLSNGYRELLERNEYFKKNSDVEGSLRHFSYYSQERREYQTEFERLAIVKFLRQWPMILQDARETGVPEDVINNVMGDFPGVW